LNYFKLIKYSKVLRYTIYYFESHLYCIMKWWHCPLFLSPIFFFVTPLLAPHDHTFRFMITFTLCVTMFLGPYVVHRAGIGSTMEHGIHFQALVYTLPSHYGWQYTRRFCTASSRAYGQRHNFNPRSSSRDQNTWQNASYGHIPWHNKGL
jgi:hypothetical protein